MSDMHFREPNQVKWQGSRPGHNGVQVIIGEQTAVLNWTVFYTVPAGKILYLCQSWLGTAIMVVGAVGMAVHDDADVFQYRLHGSVITAAITNMPDRAKYWPPLEIPAGYTIKHYQAANTQLIYGIKGWTD